MLRVDISKRPPRRAATCRPIFSSRNKENHRARRFLPGDIEDCVVEDLNQGQFTPLSEALCLVILELTSANQNATIDTVRSALKILFSNIQPPAEHVVYDAIVNLMSENKVLAGLCARFVRRVRSPPIHTVPVYTFLFFKTNVYRIELEMGKKKKRKKKQRRDERSSHVYILYSYFYLFFSFSFLRRH